MPPQKLTKSTTQPMKGGSSRSKNKPKYQKGGVMPETETKLLDKMGEAIIEIHQKLHGLVSEYTSYITEKLTESCKQNAAEHDKQQVDRINQERLDKMNAVIDQYVKLNGQGKDTIETVRKAVKNCRLSNSSGYEYSGGKKPKKASKQITN